VGLLLEALQQAVKANAILSDLLQVLATREIDVSPLAIGLDQQAKKRAHAALAKSVTLVCGFYEWQWSLPSGLKIKY